MGYSWKPYIIIGFVLWLFCNVCIVILGNNIGPLSLIGLMTISQIGVVLVTTANAGFVPWITSRESTKQKGNFQAQVDLFGQVAGIVILIIVFLMFSGPKHSCGGYEADLDVPCSTDEAIISSNSMSPIYPDDWCHMQCPEATFPFSGGTIGLICMEIVFVIIGIPFIFPLKEPKRVSKSLFSRLESMWQSIRNSAVYEVTLFLVTMSIISVIINPGYPYFQVALISSSPINVVATSGMNAVFSFVAVALIMKYGLGVSWHKYFIFALLFESAIMLIKLLSVFDIGPTRNPVFFVLLQALVPIGPLFRFMAIMFAINVIAEPGLEAVTISMVLTASSAAVTVAAFTFQQQLLQIFPLVSSTETIVMDTTEMRMQFLQYDMVAIAFRFSFILMLPLLPRQRTEAAALRDKNEQSSWWAVFCVASTLTFLAYSTMTSVLPLVFPSAQCYKVFGGSGCTEDESSLLSILSVVIILGYCYYIPLALIYWPIIKGKEKFSWNMFL